ncbi:MAG: C40 family peptidase [Candidatus Omnitrophica bacterium]|nr:C40 family peptidase [Candidatus Omnitrophota bacterium]
MPRRPRSNRLLLSVVVAAAAVGCAGPTRVTHVVLAAVADLRAKPGGLSQPGIHDPFQETQLLYGEEIHVLRQEDGWAYVEAVEQPEYTHHRRWQGYPGWVIVDLLHPVRQPPPANAFITVPWATVWENPHAATSHLRLPMGTKAWVTPSAEELWAIRLVDGATGWVSRGSVTLSADMAPWPESMRRERIVRLAEQFLGDPYLWGGRSPYAGLSDPPATGVDCSGLVNLSYRAAGVDIPRDSHEQRLKARPVEQPEPADVIFLSEQDRPSKIIHVMLYAGDGWIIEGPRTGLAIRRIRVVDRLGLPIESLRPGETVERQTITFGSYFP